jgi:hypothetical protein
LNIGGKPMTDQEFVEKLLSKLDEMNEELFITKKANTKLKSDNQYLVRVIRSYKKEFGSKRKPKYHNEPRWRNS